MRVLLIFYLVSVHNALSKTSHATPGLRDRINLLKYQIAVNHMEKTQSRGWIPPINVYDSSSNSEEYEDVSGPITPIMDEDERKKNHQYELRQLKTTPTVTIQAFETTLKIQQSSQTSQTPLKSSKPDLSSQTSQQTKHHRSKKLRSKKKLKSMGILREIFYRRNFIEELRFKTFPWIHCTELITPFITGMQKNVSKIKILTTDDRVVFRLTHLIKLNTADYSQEEIYSVLYQISNMQLRFFQWGHSALNALQNAISPDVKNHSFKTLKYGIKKLFVKWKLDISNTTNLLKQARVFRPPCFGPPYEGSTISPTKNLIYKPSKPPKPTCEPNYDSMECRRQEEGLSILL